MKKPLFSSLQAPVDFVIFEMLQASSIAAILRDEVIQLLAIVLPNLLGHANRAIRRVVALFDKIGFLPYKLLVRDGH